MTLAQPSLLFYDANTQVRDDKARVNGRSAGSAVPQTEEAPKLEEGTVDVAGKSFLLNYYAVIVIYIYTYEH